MKTILSIMLVLAMAGSVMAEPCSTPWVLWHKESKFTDTGNKEKDDFRNRLEDRTWKIVKAYDHQKECNAHVTKILASYAEWNDSDPRVSKDANPPMFQYTQKLNGHKGNITIEGQLFWFCLPNGTKPTD